METVLFQSLRQPRTAIATPKSWRRRLRGISQRPKIAPLMWHASTHRWFGHNYNNPKSLDDLNTSSATLRKIMMGQQKPNPNSMGWVDVADVARAHIAAYEHPEAGGRRFLCAADEVPTWTEAACWLKEMYAAYPIVCDAPDGGAGLKMTLDCSGLKSLSSFAFTPLKATLKVQCDSLVALGFATQ